MNGTEPGEIRLLEGVGLFLECLDFPEGVPDAELRQALALHLEAESPLSLENLLWGYYRGGGGRVWLFALPRGDARAAGYDGGEAAEVLPPVLPALVYFESAGAETPLLVRGAGRSVLFTRGTDGKPEAMALPPESEERFLRLPMAGGDGSGEAEPPGPVVRLFESADFGDRRKLMLVFREGDGPEAATREIPLEERDVRSADIRPEEERSHWESSLRKMALYRRVAWAGLAALVLGGLVHLLLLIPLSGEDKRRKNLDELAERARQVEEAQELALSLRQIGSGGFRPFHILGRVNQVRPDSVYFTSVQVRNPNRMDIGGLSTTVAKVNEFAEQVRAMDEFSGVESTVSSRAGRVSFELAAEYSNRGAEAEEEPRAGESEEAGS